MEQQDNQTLDLFQLLPENERPQAVKSEPTSTKTATATKSAAVKATTEPEPEEYEHDRQVWYAGQKLDVPSRTMKIEDVRKWLEESFYPELTKERCELVYDKDKHALIPVLKAHKKGAENTIVRDTLTVYTETPTQFLPVYYLLDNAGITWEVRRTQTGVFRTPVVGRHSEDGSLSPHELHVPRVPICILEEILYRFKSDVYIEHLAYIVWNSHSGYRVHWPKIKLATATTVYTEERFMETDEEFVVAHIHSHGKLHAFFSATDNADEIATRFYGVIGQVDKAKPQMAFRQSCGGKYTLLRPEALFTGNVQGLVNVVC